MELEIELKIFLNAKISAVLVAHETSSLCDCQALYFNVTESFLLVFKIFRTNVRVVMYRGGMRHTSTALYFYGAS
jgi:hypothetical protein